jgi:hypothetical protein
MLELKILICTALQKSAGLFFIVAGEPRKLIQRAGGYGC